MEIFVLDSNFETLTCIDRYESLIWTERYFEAGDFELYLPLDIAMVQILVKDNYLFIKESDVIMVIETIDIDTSEKGVYVKVSGRSLESILDRRIVWAETEINDTLQNGIKRLINENAISPSIADRKIPNLTFKDSTDTRITSLPMEAYYYGDNLYDSVVYACTEANIGFKIRLVGGKMQFEFYKGLDRTYNQTDRPYVIFSPEYDNILTSEYYESNEGLKNCALVSNEVREKTEIDSEGNATVTPGYMRTVEVKPDWYQSGLGRREVFYDVSVADEDEDGNELTEDEKKAQMKTEALEELAETNITKVFDASVDASRQFIYRKDFDIGDVVQIKNEYGYESKARITEIIISSNTEGDGLYPTFTVIENI